MSQRIEGLFLRATKIKHNSIIVDLLTRQYGRSTLFLLLAPKKIRDFYFNLFILLSLVVPTIQKKK